MEFLEQFAFLIELSFWENLLAQFQHLGALPPICLAAIESLIPALPLVGIVLLNVTAHGFLWGLLYSWVGSCVGSTLVFFFYRKAVRPHLAKLVSRYQTLQKAQDWVADFNPTALFFLAIMPFTPSSFLNLAFGIADYSAKKYLATIICAKLIMISLLALFGQSFVTAFTRPWVIVVSLSLVAGLYYLSKKLNQKYKL